MMAPSRGQAALLTFYKSSKCCPRSYNNLSSHWKKLVLADHTDSTRRCVLLDKSIEKGADQVKMMVADGGSPSEIIVQGDDQQIEQMRKELQLNEKVYLKDENV